MVSTRSYPRTAATMAKATPVLPLVGSTRVVTPGLMSPRFSASSIKLAARNGQRMIKACHDV